LGRGWREGVVLVVMVAVLAVLAVLLVVVVVVVLSLVALLPGELELVGSLVLGDLGWSTLRPLDDADVSVVGSRTRMARQKVEVGRVDG